MSSDLTGPIVEYLTASRDVMSATLNDTAFIGSIAKIAERITASLAAGGKVLLAGNGGSASDAQHLAGELLCRMNYDRAPLAAVALTTDSSVMTAIANDYGYEQVFERQVLGLGRAGDIFIGISTSGRSKNILRAVAAAHANGLVTIGFTGRTGGDMTAACDLCLRAPSEATPLIQQVHITAGHIICGLVEEALFPRTVRSQDLAAEG